MARHDAVSPEGDKKIKELLLAGHSIAVVARATGVVDKTVAVRRAELKKQGAQFPLCGCGRSVSHTGCCKHRAEQRRDAPVASRPRGRVTRSTVYDFAAWDSHRRRIRGLRIPDASAPAKDLLMFVESAIPKSFNPHIRDDLVQDVLVALLTGDIAPQGLAGALQQFTRNLYEMFPDVGAPISLDEPVYSGRRLETVASFIADDRPLPGEELDLDDDEMTEYICSLQALSNGVRPGFRRRREET